MFGILYSETPLPMPEKEESRFLWCAIRYDDNTMGYGVFQYDFGNQNWELVWKNSGLSYISIVSWSYLPKHAYIPAPLSDTMKKALHIIRKYGYVFQSRAGWTYPDCPIKTTKEGKEYLEWSCQVGTLLALKNRGLITIKDQRAFCKEPMEEIL